MTRDRFGGGAPGPKEDERIAAIETITIPFETFKKALRRNYLDEETADDSRDYRLRIAGPFEAEMDVEYYETESGSRYASDVDPKPLHIHPEQLVFQGIDGGFREIREWPTRATIKEKLAEGEIEAAGDPVAALEAAREEFWADLRARLPEEIDLGFIHGYQSDPVAIEWAD